MAPRRILLKLPVGSDPESDAGSLLEIAARAEDAGFDGVELAEHVVLGEDTSQYTWGEFPYPPDSPWLEPLSLLAAIAARTSTLVLCTGILITPLRPATLLAKTVATVDRISGGRLELGVGTGWHGPEFTAQGLDHARRGDYLTDGIGACRALWGVGPASFTSSTVSFDDIHCEPKPTRAGGPPISFSGTLTKRNIDRIVRLGDGWMPIMTASEQDVLDGRRELDDALRAAGRSTDALSVRLRVPLVEDASGRPSLEATLSEAPRWWEHGATDLVLPFSRLYAGWSTFGTWFDAVGPLLPSR